MTISSNTPPPFDGSSGSLEPIQVIKEIGYKTQSWQITMTSETLEFDLVGEPGTEGMTHISLERGTALKKIRTESGMRRNFSKLNGKFTGIILCIKSESDDPSLFGTGVMYDHKFILSKEDWGKVQAWLSETPVELMEEVQKEVSGVLTSELRGRGVVYTILGIAHFVFSKTLEPTWGVILVVIGLLNIIIPKRGLFILNGFALLVVGLANMCSGQISGSMAWRVLGIAQIIWGIAEFGRFAYYGTSVKAR